MTIKIIVNNTNMHHREAKSWCHENIGSDWWGDEYAGKWSWQMQGAQQKDIGHPQIETVAYFFKNESDAVEFALRFQ